MVRIPAGRLRHTALYLTGTAACILFIGLVARIAGQEILTLYLHSSYRAYPIILIGLPAATGIVCLCLAVLSGCAVFRGGDARTNVLLQMTAAILLCACTAAAGLFLRQQARRYTGIPSVPAKLNARIGPFAQFGPFSDRRADTATSMTVWYFDPVRADRPAELEFSIALAGTQPAILREAPGGDGLRHEFHCTGLEPGTRYRYRVRGRDEDWRFFTTAPARGMPFRFLCLADTGNTLAGGSAPSCYNEVTIAAADWYRSIGALPFFMIHGGDAVRTGTDIEGWRASFAGNAMAGPVPVLAAPGNHEMLEDGGANFRYLYGTPDYCSIDCGDCRIIMLHPYDGPGRTLDGPVICTGADQYRWAKRELARPRAGRWLIVVIHNPILSTGDYGMNELLAGQYLDLFREHRVDMVVSGHDHNFDAFLADGEAPWGGTLYLVTGTGGSHLDSGIMDRPERRWLDWRHDRRSVHGLYQHDALTERFHMYGELSWGFTDVEVRGGTMTVTYRRWLSFPRFLEMTGQERQAWDIARLCGPGSEPKAASGVEEAWILRKIKD